jgi:hypothetical protein
MDRAAGKLAILLGLAGCTELPVQGAPEERPTCTMRMLGEVDDPSVVTAAGLSVDQVVESVTWQSDTVLFAWGDAIDGPVSVGFDAKGTAVEMEYSGSPGEVCATEGVHLIVSGRARVEVVGWASADDRVSLTGDVHEGVFQEGSPFPMVGEPALQEAYEAARGERCDVFRPFGRLSGGTLSVELLGTCGGRDVDEPLFEATAEG